MMNIHSKILSYKMEVINNCNLYINAEHFNYYIKAENSKKFRNNSFNSV